MDKHSSFLYGSVTDEVEEKNTGTAMKPFIHHGCSDKIS
jgi:hypothetical protein